VKLFERELPEILLRRDTAMSISKLSEVRFAQTDSFHFFESGNCLYGFVKQADVKFFDMTVFAKFEKSSKFVLSKSDFIDLNDMVTGTAVSKISNPSFVVEKGNLNYSFEDTGYEISISRSIPVEGDDIPEIFHFQAALIGKLMKSVPDELLTFHRVMNERYYVTGDSGFVALIIGLVNI
jgi:hypothetical protein